MNEKRSDMKKLSFDPASFKIAIKFLKIILVIFILFLVFKLFTFISKEFKEIWERYAELNKKIESNIYRSIQSEIPIGIRDFLQKSCVLLSLCDTVSSKIGTGFLVQDTSDSHKLFLVTARHNFYVPSILNERPKKILCPNQETILSTKNYYQEIDSVRNQIFFWILCQQKDRDTLIIEKINVIYARDTSKTLSLNPDYEKDSIDLAIYRFEINTNLKYHFFTIDMLSISKPFESGIKIFACGFGTGGYNRKINFLKPRCNEGNIIVSTDSLSMETIPDISLKKGYASLDMQKEIIEGESGSPIILNLGNMESINEVKLCGVLVTCRGLDRPSGGTMVMVKKINDMIAKFYKRYNFTIKK